MGRLLAGEEAVSAGVIADIGQAFSSSGVGTTTGTVAMIRQLQCAVGTTLVNTG
jgi:hypothetical protein